MGNKIFKTLDEQIKILREKGLVIDDEKFAKEVLLRDKSRYIEGTKFEELYSLFLFDRTLRNILFKNILIVENNIKSIISTPNLLVLNSTIKSGDSLFMIFSRLNPK